ncbi:MAG: hypothetical protein ACK5HL_02085 [Bacilli bacterium]
MKKEKLSDNAKNEIIEKMLIKKSKFNKEIVKNPKFQEDFFDYLKKYIIMKILKYN